MKYAVVVIDMIHDFVYGKLGSEGAKEIIPNIEDLLKSASENDVPIYFVEDSHEEGDKELELWGEHAMEKKKGSQTVSDLDRFADEKLEKHTYSAFFETGLDELICSSSIDRLILVGVSTDICIQNSAAIAFFDGYEMIVPPDCTAAISKDKRETALEYMKNVYGVELEESEDIIEYWNR